MMYMATSKCDIPTTVFIPKGYSVRVITKDWNSWNWTDVKEALERDLHVEIPYSFLSTAHWDVERIS